MIMRTPVSVWRTGGLNLIPTKFLCFLLLLLPFSAYSGSSDSVALSGFVQYKNQPMEGVVVIAHHQNSQRLTAVTSAENGRYEFPADRLGAGDYTLTVRAAGYELPERVSVQVGTRPATQLLSLQAVTAVTELAAQMTSLDWVRSYPGDEADKDLLIRNMVNCAFCHSLERISRSSHSKQDFLRVIQRMKTYETDHSSAVRIQRVATPEPIEGMQWYGRQVDTLAEYLATVNLSGGKKEWDYPLTFLPRPTGEGTKAVVTVYPIERQPSVIHDMDVDADGNAWYGNTGWDFIGRLNPDTGEFAEWEAPNFLPAADPDSMVDRIVGVQDIQVDPAGRVWVGVMGNKHAAFIPQTERWKVYDLPVIWKNPFLGPVRDGEVMLWGSGITKPPEGPVRHEHGFGLNVETGKLTDGIMLFNDKPSPESPHHDNQLNYCYMFDQDLDGNFLCTAPEPSAIARADEQGNVRLIPTPTPFSYPRRGYRDDQNRFWFSEFFADRIGVINLDNDEIREYELHPRYISPYYARPDREGHIWISSTGSDRLLRLNPENGEVVQYLMPVTYDARKVVVDNRADRITVWLPNKNEAQLIRVEIPN